MNNLCIALRYNKPNKLTKVFFLLRYFNKTRVSVLFLRFPYFELRNIYKRFRIRVRIPISTTVVDSFVDIGASLVLSMWFVLAILYLTLETSGL